MALRPDGPAEFYGTVVAKNGIARLQGYGGNAESGVLYFGTGLDKYLYWDGAQLQPDRQPQSPGKARAPGWSGARSRARLEDLRQLLRPHGLAVELFWLAQPSGHGLGATFDNNGKFGPVSIARARSTARIRSRSPAPTTALWLHYPGVRRARFKQEYNDRLYYVDQSGSAFFSIGPSGDYIKGNGHSMVSTDNFLSYFSMRHVSHTYSGGSLRHALASTDVVLYGGVVTDLGSRDYYKYPQFQWNGTWYGY